MTAALMSAADRVELPAAPGLSPRAARAVLKTYCRIAQHDGSFRYGLRASKVAALADYSLSVVRRAQKFLVAHGFLDRVEVGGGRRATRWRVVLAKLGLRHGSRPAVTPQPSAADTALEHPQRLFARMFSGRRGDRGGPPGRPPDEPGPPSRAARAAAPGSVAEALAMDWAALAGSNAPQVFDTCEQHGGRAGRMASGSPWCPDCRRRASQRPA